MCVCVCGVSQQVRLHPKASKHQQQNDPSRPLVHGSSSTATDRGSSSSSSVGRGDAGAADGAAAAANSGAALPIPWSCSEESLLLLVAARDPNAIGVWLRSAGLRSRPLPILATAAALTPL